MKHQFVFRLFFVVALGMGLSLSSCNLFKGDTGPAGPKGDPGLNGNYNVDAFTFDISSWTAQGAEGTFGYQVVSTLNIPELTSDIVDEGLVMVYFQFSGDPAWYALPYTYPSGSYTEVMDYWALVGQLVLRVRATDYAAAQPVGKARVVIASADGLAEIGELDWADYQRVSAELGLEP